MTFARKLGLLRAALSLILLPAGAATAQSPPDVAADPTGEWVVAKQVAHIRIADCGDGKLWGVVAWEARPGGVDRKNPDPTLQSRPTLGMPILLGMQQTKKNEWDGKIYNSQDGHTYSADISLVDPNTLRVQGCFLGFLCGGENWTRYEEPPQGPGSAPKSKNVKPAPKSARGGRAVETPSTPRPIRTAQDVCLSVFGPAWLSHERGLK